MTAEFQPKGEETLRTEALEVLGVDAYEGNEEVVDRVVARLKTEEDFKASVHTQKKSAQSKAEQRAELLKKAGFDPETGEKITTNVVEPVKEEKDLSGDDLYALMEAKVQKVDLPLVKQTAKALGLSISEALNHPVTKTVLQNAQEERKTAETANVGTNRKVNTKLNGESLIKKAHDGKLEDAEIGEAAKLTLNSMFKG